MFELLLAATAIFLAVGMLIGYGSTRDVLHPMLFIGPLFFYGAVLDPWLVQTDLARFLPESNDTLFVLALDLFSVAALVTGTLHGGSTRIATVGRKRSVMSQHQAALLLKVAFALGLWGLTAYSIGILNAGGFVAAYSQAKGGGYSASGYISEGMNLGLVTAVMTALGRYRRGWTLSSVVLLALGLIPNLLQGTFGGRRGPLFMALAAAILAWLMTRKRMPRLWMLWPSLAAAGVAVVFVASQRQFLYLGSGESVNWDEFKGAVAQERPDEGNNFIYGAAFITATRRSNHFSWGRELAINLLVRPIPRQLWPNKYEDTGATWVDYPGLGHLTMSDWLGTVGWLPLEGSSAISISDVYGEFGWGTVLVFYLIGRGFAALYSRRRRLGQMWELLYLEALTLAIYLATQSFSAFYHRYLILAIPTVIIWRNFIEPRRAARGYPVNHRTVAHLAPSRQLRYSRGAVKS